MKVRYALGLLLLACLTSVIPLAYASPPDPTWTEGIYDDADGDEVVISLSWASLPVHRLERLALLPLAALVAALGWATRRDPGDRYQAEFRTLLLSRALLFSPTVILTAQRAERAGGGARSE